MKKFLLILWVAIMLLGGGTAFADTGETVSKLKGWNFSAGDAVYLMKSDAFYLGVNVHRDIAMTFKSLPEGYLYWGAGYLHDEPFSDVDGSKAKFANINATVNAGRLLVETAEVLGKKMNANFNMPAPIHELLIRVGWVVAKQLNEDVWSIDKGWDTGWIISILKYEF
jgi:energy-coupling factor transporter transmembrane protein EcfT